MFSLQHSYGKKNFLMVAFYLILKFSMYFLGIYFGKVILFRNLLNASHRILALLKCRLFPSHAQGATTFQGETEDQGGHATEILCLCFSSLAFALSKFSHPSHLFSLLLCPSGNHPTIQKKAKSGFHCQPSSQESDPVFLIWV